MYKKVQNEQKLYNAWHRISAIDRINKERPFKNSRKAMWSAWKGHRDRLVAGHVVS